VLPLRFCEGPVPDWFVDASGQIIGLALAGGGRFDSVSGDGDVKRALGELGRRHVSDSYGGWLLRFLGE
jgi:hypothetical protein